MDSLNLYQCLLDEDNGKNAFIQVFRARGVHIGDAVEKVLAAARDLGMTRPRVREIDPCDEESMQGSIDPPAKSGVSWMTGRAFFDPEPSFSIPYGVIGSGLDGGWNVDDIVPGYLRANSEDGKHTLVVNVDEQDLTALYQKMLRLHPVYRVFWYMIHDHWDDAEELFLVNESLDSPEAIAGHLAGNPLESIMNGHVSLVAYLEQGTTNLTISDHKQIVISTFSEEIADLHAELLENNGYPEMEELVSIGQGIHHWHYRHPASKSRPDLLEHLRSNGFKDWQPGS